MTPSCRGHDPIPALDDGRGLLVRPLPATLPCFPCPHAPNCCSWGTALEADEAAAIREQYGDAALRWSDEEQQWRTAIVNGRCIFRDRGCMIHDKPFYPRICRGFPWRYGDTDEP